MGRKRRVGGCGEEEEGKDKGWEGEKGGRGGEEKEEEWMWREKRGGESGGEEGEEEEKEGGGEVEGRK